MMTSLEKMIDHTLLKPNVTDQQILQLCEEARQYGFASVCVNPCYVRLAADALRDSGVKICTVIGFPLGATTTESKLFEAAQAVQNGADELDYVLNISDVLNGRYELVKQEMEQFVQFRANSSKPVLIKVILETCYLTDEQIVKVCKLAKEAGIDFVKTSTGFGSGGATKEHVRIMRETVGSKVGVKASGGIRTYEDCVAMVEAGANRIGASASVAIVTRGSSDRQSAY
ncbi:deoxyribose-phosphate aldolase [Brevibacillus marinus]|uniref:deoxyribose-phosphate aldolase n=1 Tax=Brevibacillus marinus TaxID=2496837 RepID=UPI000F8490E1|nr:deoxyribose-phosphate aldolase [Brevibacillus marinus]